MVKITTNKEIMTIKELKIIDELEHNFEYNGITKKLKNLCFVFNKDECILDKKCFLKGIKFLYGKDIHNKLKYQLDTFEKSLGSY